MASKFALLFDRKSGLLTALTLGAISLLIFAAGCVVGANVDWYQVAEHLGLQPLAEETAPPEPAHPAQAAVKKPSS